MAATRQTFINRLPSKTLRNACTAIDQAIAGPGSVAWSYDEIAERCHISRAAVAKAIRSLRLVGLISVTSGQYRVSVITAADGWVELDASDIEERLARAKMPLPGRPRKHPAASRAASRRPAAETIEPDDIEPPARCEPSLPVLRFMQDWPER